MTNFTISAEARITLCPDGYECCGQRQASNGTVDFVESPRWIDKVICPKTDKVVVRKITNLSNIWRSLIRIANITSVAGETKVEAEVLKFCKEFGVPRFPDESTAPTQLESIRLSEVVGEAIKMRDAFLNANGNFIQGPKALDDAIQSTDLLRLAMFGKDRSVDLEGALFAGWFDLVNALRKKPTACDFCRGLNVSRKKSRFCSDFCRDKHHKQILRS